LGYNTQAKVPNRDFLTARTPLLTSGRPVSILKTSSQNAEVVLLAKKGGAGKFILLSLNQGSNLLNPHHCNTKEEKS
jgi:hypothetical protein